MNKVTIVNLERELPNSEERFPGRLKTTIFDEAVSNNALIVYQRFKIGTPVAAYHVHHKSENIWIVLRGTLEAIIGGVRYLVHENEIVYMPNGVPHATGNGGNVEMHAIEIYAPPLGVGEATDTLILESPAVVHDAPADTGQT